MNLTTCRMVIVATWWLCLLTSQVFGKWKQIFPEDGFSGMVSLTSMIGFANIGVTLSRCYTLCLADLDCMSFFHNKDTKSCQLHSIVFLYSHTLSTSPGFEYYRMADEQCDQKSGYMLNRRLEICFAFIPMYDAFDLDILREYCQNASGGRMMMINSMEKNDLVEAIAKTGTTLTEEILFGLTRSSAASTTWIWSDGETLTWSNWYTPAGEPRMPPDALCVATQTNMFYGWNDRPCTGTSQMSVACER